MNRRKFMKLLGGVAAAFGLGGRAEAEVISRSSPCGGNSTGLSSESCVLDSGCECSGCGCDVACGYCPDEIGAPCEKGCVHSATDARPLEMQDVPTRNGIERLLMVDGELKWVAVTGTMMSVMMAFNAEGQWTHTEGQG